MRVVIGMILRYEAHILKATPVDLIIGRDSIKKFNLFSKVPSQLGVKLPTPKPSQPSKCSTGPCACPSEIPLTLVAKPRTGPVIRSLLASLTVEAQHTLRGSAPDDDEIDHDKTDTFKPWLLSPSTIDVSSLIHVSGDKDLQHRLRYVRNLKIFLAMSCLQHQLKYLNFI